MSWLCGMAWYENFMAWDWNVCLYIIYGRIDGWWRLFTTTLYMDRASFCGVQEYVKTIWKKKKKNVKLDCCYYLVGIIYYSIICVVCGVWACVFQRTMQCRLPLVFTIYGCGLFWSFVDLYFWHGPDCNFMLLIFVLFSKYNLIRWKTNSQNELQKNNNPSHKTKPKTNNTSKTQC